MFNIEITYDYGMVTQRAGRVQITLEADICICTNTCLYVLVGLSTVTRKARKAFGSDDLIIIADCIFTSILGNVSFLKIYNRVADV